MNTFYDVNIPAEMIKLLDANQLARVLSVCRARRVFDVEQLPPGPRSVIESIVLDARMREEANPRPRKTGRFREKKRIKK
jgi:hypothetical protein